MNHRDKAYIFIVYLEQLPLQKLYKSIQVFMGMIFSYIIYLYRYTIMNFSLLQT